MYLENTLQNCSIFELEFINLSHNCQLWNGNLQLEWLKLNVSSNRCLPIAFTFLPMFIPISEHEVVFTNLWQIYRKMLLKQ